VATSFSNRAIAHFHVGASFVACPLGSSTGTSSREADGKCQAASINSFREATVLTSTSSSAASAEDTSATDSPNAGKFTDKLKKLVNNVKAAPFALSVAALYIGYKIGTKTTAASLSSATATSTTQSAAAATVKSTARQYPIIALILLVVAVRDVWSLIPHWAKKNIPIVGRRSKVPMDDADPDDLTSFTSISLKLRSLFQRGKDKLSAGGEDDAIESPGLVFLALIRLMSQLKNQLAERRDRTYMEAGREIENPRDVLEGMDEAFEFADWAYNEFEEGQSLKKNLSEKGYTLLRHEQTALPGHVAHYVAVSPDKKEALIGIKGTSTLEDFMTDSCGNAVKYRFEDGPFVEGGRREINCHEGILLSSKRLADDLTVFVDQVLLPLGYKIRVVGHSLGAGVGVIFGMILRSRIEALRRDEGVKLKVLAFASPPILDIEASRSCKSFVTTFINNSDIIPRASLTNLVLLMEFMKSVSKRLDEDGLSPTNIRSTAKFLKMLANDKHAEKLMSVDEIMDGVAGALSKVEIDDPEHLYVGGRVIHMYDQWTKEGYGNKSDYEDVGDDFEESKKVPTAEKLYESDSTATPLRLIEIDDRMM